MKEIYDIATGEKIEYKSQFRNPSNFEFGQFYKDIEECEGISLTVPDLSYTVREILEKFTRGVPMELNNEGTYEEIEDFTGLEPENAIDITDVETQLNDINEMISLAKSKATRGSIKGEVLGGEKSVPDITEPNKATEATT